MHDVAMDISIFPRVSSRKRGKLFACQVASLRWPRLLKGPKACVVKDILGKVQAHSLLSPPVVRFPIIHLDVEVYWCSAQEPCSQSDDSHRNSSIVSSDR